MPRRTQTPTDIPSVPDLDSTNELQPRDITLHQEMIGMLCWARLTFSMRSPSSPNTRLPWEATTLHNCWEHPAIWDADTSCHSAWIPICQALMNPEFHTTLQNSSNIVRMPKRNCQGSAQGPEASLLSQLDSWMHPTLPTKSPRDHILDSGG